MLASPPPEDARAFSNATVASLNREWAAAQKARNRPFKAPRAIYLALPVGHPAGGSGYDARVGLVIDLADVERVRTAFGPEGDDLAALMIAHEYGHAVQEREGVSAAMPPGPEREQQADCYSGWWWGRSLARRGEGVRLNLERRFPELLRLLSISRTGSLSAQSDTARHGEGPARVEAIKLGLETARPEVCGL